MDDMTDEASTTTSASELTPADERIAVLERLAALRPELGQLCREMVDLERARERCRKLEERTRVVLPPDTSRWSGKPAPSSTSPVEPSAQRPNGWRPLDPIASPPGVGLIDAMVEADTARQRLDYLAAEHMRKQAVLDMHAEQKLAEKEYRREQAERSSFHRAPGDPDFPAQ
jgi:hypothetical protein